MEIIGQYFSKGKFGYIADARSMRKHFCPKPLNCIDGTYIKAVVKEYEDSHPDDVYSSYVVEASVEIVPATSLSSVLGDYLLGKFAPQSSAWLPKADKTRIAEVASRGSLFERGPVLKDAPDPRNQRINVTVVKWA